MRTLVETPSQAGNQSIKQDNPARPAQAPAGAAMQNMADDSPHVRQLRKYASMARNSPLTTQLKASSPAVAQLTKKQDIVALGKGFTDVDAEDLKTIAGGWVNALTMAKGTTAVFLRKVVATGYDRLDQYKILNQLDEHFYDLANLFVGHNAGDFIQLVRKGLNNKLVDGMTGYPVPQLRGLVLSMATNAAFTDIGRLGFICDNYPAFVPIIGAQIGGAAAALQTVISWLATLQSGVLAVIEAAAPTFAALQAMSLVLTATASLPKILASYNNFRAITQAQMIAAPALLQTVITHLSTRSDGVLTWLEANNPNFAVLQVLVAQDPSEDMLGMLVNFAKEAAPGDGAYEAIGAQGNEYRIGHFARGHTLRGMPAVPALNGMKTLWPDATTLAQVRDVCLNFDQHNPTVPNAIEYFYSYTPTVAPTTQIYAAKNLPSNSFDQLFPRNGTDITAGEATTLGAINAVKANWTAFP